jgi:hypothetical protein
MSKSAEERMMQKRIYTGIIERTKTIIFAVSTFWIIKWYKHKLGDMITIKSIIENQAILVLINILKIKKTLIKPT